MTEGLPVLENNLVYCEPFKDAKDWEYLFDLCSGCKYTKVDKETMRKVFLETDGYFWSIYAKEKNIKGGVIYFTWLNNQLWLHAYRSDTVVRDLLARKDYSYVAAKLLLEYAEKNLSLNGDIWTTHAKENRGATLLCRRLKFKFIKTINTQFGDFVVMMRGKNGA